MDTCTAVTTIFTLAHALTAIGLLLAGLLAGLGANLERIGRIARWKADLERGVDAHRPAERNRP